MTKNEYIKKLKRALRQVKREERNKSLAYFSEVIDDRVEEGVSEENTVAELESVEEAAERIIAEAKAQGQLKPKRSVWEIILLVLGFPLWFPLLLTIGIVVFTIYGVVWIMIAALFILAVALAVCGPAGIVCMFIVITSNTAAGFALLGIGLACAGLGVAIFIPALYIAQAYAKMTPVIWNKIVNRKESF